MVLHPITVEHGDAAVVAMDRTGDRHRPLRIQQTRALIGGNVDIIGNRLELLSCHLENWTGIDAHCRNSAFCCLHPGTTLPERPSCLTPDRASRKQRWASKTRAMPATPSLTGPAIWVDVEDLLDYFRFNPHPSGYPARRSRHHPRLARGSTRASPARPPQPIRRSDRDELDGAQGYDGHAATSRAARRAGRESAPPLACPAGNPAVAARVARSVVPHRRAAEPGLAQRPCAAAPRPSAAATATSPDAAAGVRTHTRARPRRPVRRTRCAVVGSRIRRPSGDAAVERCPNRAAGARPHPPCAAPNGFRRPGSNASAPGSTAACVILTICCRSRASRPATSPTTRPGAPCRWRLNAC